MRRYLLLPLAGISLNVFADSAFVASEFSEQAFTSTQFTSESDVEFSTEFGASLTSGNTDTQTYKGKLQGSFVYPLGRVNYHGEFFKKISSEEVSADKWKVGLKNNLNFTEHGSSFASIEVEQDQFANFDSVATFAAGYSRLMLNDDILKWDADIGPGYKLKSNDQERLHEYVMHLGSQLSVQLSGEAEFIQTFIADLGVKGDASDVVRAESALLTTVLDNLKMKLSYALKHNNKPGDGKEKLDTQTTVSMVFIF